jgi:hypothetical protein
LVDFLLGKLAVPKSSTNLFTTAENIVLSTNPGFSIYPVTLGLFDFTITSSKDWGSAKMLIQSPLRLSCGFGMNLY